MIGRVWNAYRSELKKLRHRRIGHWAFGAALVAVFFGAGLARIGEAAARLQGAKVEAANGFVVLADCLGYGVGAGAIVLVIFAGLLMAEETELGTAKILFSKPVRRAEVVLAKALLLLTLAVGLVAFVAAASLAVAGAFFGFGDVVDPALRDYVYHTEGVMFRHVATAIPQLVPPLFAALMMAFVMSALVDQSGIAVGLAFAFLTVSMAGTWLFDRAKPWLLTTYFSFATEMLRDIATGITGAQWSVRWPKGPPKLALGLVLSVAYALVAWLVATVAVARRAILGIAIAAIVALGAGEPALAGNGMAFDLLEVEVTGQVWDVTPTDVDQDGLGDLVVFHVIGRKGPEPRRFLSIFYGRRGGGAGGVDSTRGDGAAFAPRPDQTIEVEPEACVRFIADVDAAAKGQELGFIGPRGGFCYAAANRMFAPHAKRRLFADEGFFDIAAGTQLPDWDALVKDVDGDARPDIVFPKKGAFALYLQKEGGGFASVLDVALEYKQYFGTRVETLLLNRFINYWGMLAKPVLVDIDGNRRLDVVRYMGNGLDVFLQRSGGMVASSPFGRDPDRRTAMQVFNEETAQGDDSYNAVNVDFEDVDSDGVSDMILYRNVGKIGLFETMRTQVLFHRARGGGEGWSDQPDQVLNLKGVSISPGIIDTDNDGAKDLVVSSLRTDLVTNAKRALFSSVTVTYYVFRYDKKEGKFRTTPDYSRDLTIDISRIEGGGTIPLAVFHGDFNGDKLPDLLSLEENDRVRIFPGGVEDSWWEDAKLVYEEDDEEVVKVQTSNSYRIGDFDKDGKSDFLFWYFDKNWESKEVGKVRVAVSK